MNKIFFNLLIESYEATAKSFCLLIQQLVIAKISSKTENFLKRFSTKLLTVHQLH